MSSQYPTSLDNFSTKTGGQTISESHVNNLQDAVLALQAKVGIDSSSNTASLDYKLNNFFASGRKIWLYENTAPTGWAIVNVTDRVLAVKGGSYGSTGGAQVGAWAQPAHVHAGPYHYHSMQSHTHSMQSHIHALQPPSGYTGLIGGGTWEYPASASSSTGGPSVTSTGAPSVSVTGYGGNTNTGGNATLDTWRPHATVGIIVQKS